MDCHDIFKRLSRGATFSKKCVTSSPSLQPNVSRDIKTEVEDVGDEKESVKIYQLRQKLGINTRGKNVPAPVTTFDEMFSLGMITDKIRENIRICGYEEPTPIQMQSIPIMYDNKQILACAPTGSGKTVAFLVPALSSIKKVLRSSSTTFRILILCPTQELSRQTFRSCAQLTSGTGLKPHLIKKVSNSSKFGPKYSEKFDILISTPNRLIYLLRREDNTIQFKDLKWLIIDEADKLFEDGKTGFHSQLSEIITSFKMDDVKIAMFSATFMDQLAKWSRQNLKELATVIVGKRNRTVIDVDQELIYVGNEAGKLIAFRELIRQGLTPPVLVFVQSKERAKELFSELIYDGIFVDVIHADRTALQRENVVQAFREGKIWVLICTELMGRGIDFKGVKLVINYDFPSSVISYIHCIGRTGRAGRQGKSITFFTQDDKPKLQGLAGSLKQAGCPVPDYMMNLKKISKTDKKRLAKTVPDRESIKTSVEFRKNGKKRKSKEMASDYNQKPSKKVKVSEEKPSLSLCSNNDSKKEKSTFIESKKNKKLSYPHQIPKEVSMKPTKTKKKLTC